MSKTGGGIGTNQHKIRGTSRVTSGASTVGESNVALATLEDDITDLWGLETAPTEAPAPEPEEQVRYSFIRDFQAQEEAFEATFTGVPNRFYNADLAGKFLGGKTPAELAEIIRQNPRKGHYFDHRSLTGRLCHNVSTPEDNRISAEKVEELIHELDHVTEVHPVKDAKLLRFTGANATRGWLAKLENTTENGYREERWLMVSDHSTAGMKTFTLPGGRDPIGKHQQVTQVDVRSLVGASRIASLSGNNPLGRTAMHPHYHFGTGDYPDDYPGGYSHDAYQQRIDDLQSAGTIVNEVYAKRHELNHESFNAAQLASIATLTDLQDAQLQGRNFIAQRKHLREQSGKIAGVFDDKKHPDKAHQQMMAETSLAAANGGLFAKVEIDNDVDPEEYADFEAAIEEIAEKMPPIPADRRPDLRIRKLGKHRANGLFSASHNTVAVDVRTSEAYIHEMGHYYDLVAKGNASLSADFADISQEYSHALREPDPKKRAYYDTPTEQLARGFEVYAVEKLGINNRLVNPSKFSNNDYAPYTGNPELKAKLFAFFDKTFSTKD
ncbi:hypothetical protein [Nesterenkonia rhizosphaerae]|uniref:Large polyvalent protein-associated domain-containing protein n=1 Tax=Nesterenkonia rhizosphaerae TaxID=1348272 RepID=A0ABP9G0U8_9MICC